MKKYRIEITSSDPFISIQEPDGTSHPQTYRKVQYKNGLDKAIEWARKYVQELKRTRCSVYVKTEIKEFEYVKDIKVDF